jgi:enamine deaminase RidA (YjgF/YER057c/UK114 family)
MTHKQLISSGTIWEKSTGYSRAVKVGNQIWVAGTTASDANGTVQHVGDVYAQTVYIIRKIEAALHEAGATLNDVVRTRMFVTDMARSEEVARAHGEFFHEIRPAATMVGVTALIHPDQLVEIEVDAIITDQAQ